MSMPLWLSFGALWALVLFQGLVLLGLVKTVYSGQPVHTEHHEDESDLIHQEAPRFKTVDVAGTTFDSALVSGDPRAFLFVSPRCESCTVTPQELESLTWKARGKVYIVCRGASEDCFDFAAIQGLGTDVLVDETFEISRAFKVTGAPTAVIVDETNVVTFYGNPMRDDELIEVFDEEAVRD